jgi:hypothetical protein
MNFAGLVRLKPTGDYLPFLTLVNRFIERSFEFGKTARTRVLSRKPSRGNRRLPRISRMEQPRSRAAPG